MWFQRTSIWMIGLVCGSLLLAGCGKKPSAPAVDQSSTTGEQADTQPKADPSAEENPETLQEDNAADVVPEKIKTIGLFLPSAEDKSWNGDEENIRGILAETAYMLRVYYAEGNRDLQKQQLEDFLSDEETEPEAVMVCPVDPWSLTEEMELAGELNVKAVSYDTLIMNAADLDYFVTFDMRNAGHEAAKEILKRSAVPQQVPAQMPQTEEEAQQSDAAPSADLEAAPVNGEDADAEDTGETEGEEESRLSVEIFLTGKDRQADLFFFNGFMEELEPLFEEGRFIIPSGRSSFSQVLLPEQEESSLRSSDSAMEKLKEILDGFYDEKGSFPDILVTTDEAFAREAAAYIGSLGTHSMEQGWSRPLICCEGVDVETIRDIAEGDIAFTIFVDQRTVARACAQLVRTILEGNEPEENNYGQYDNGKKIIHTVTCQAQVIDADNYHILADSQYYNFSQIDFSQTETGRTDRPVV